MPCELGAFKKSEATLGSIPSQIVIKIWGLTIIAVIIDAIFPCPRTIKVHSRRKHLKIKTWYNKVPACLTARGRADVQGKKGGLLLPFLRIWGSQNSEFMGLSLFQIYFGQSFWRSFWPYIFMMSKLGLLIKTVKFPLESSQKRPLLNIWVKDILFKKIGRTFWCKIDQNMPSFTLPGRMCGRFYSNMQKFGI